MFVWWFVWPLLLLFLFWGIAGAWPGYRGRWNGASDPWADGSRAYPSHRGLWRSSSRSSHRGKGPVGYRRSDERITEDVSDALMMSDDVDAGGIAVNVTNGVVVLSGFVHTRAEKRLAEAMADSVAGVDDVRNELRIGAAPPSQSLPASTVQATPAEPHGVG